MDTKQAVEENDIRSKVDGRYVGSIGRNNAIAFQQTIAAIEALADNIITLQEALDEQADIHEANTEHIVKMLDVKTFDMETQELMVSEDGHVWIVEAQEVEE